MPARTIETPSGTWTVSPTGRVTQYSRDEFGVFFRNRETGEVRVARYAPMGSRVPEDSLAELPTWRLSELFQRSQPRWTAPEAGYQR